jgi:hypothetical protein
MTNETNPPKKIRKFSIMALIDASAHVGFYEAETPEQALEMARKDIPRPSICHQCSKELDVGDAYTLIAEEVGGDERAEEDI